MPSTEPEKGDKVSWNWGSGKPGGTVAEKKTEGEVSITSKRGNKIKKNASPDNPAIAIERSGNDVVKRASEVNIEKKANGMSGKGSKDTKKETNKEQQTGEKRVADDSADSNGLSKNEEGKTVKQGENKKVKKEATKKNDRANGGQTDKKEEDDHHSTETGGMATAKSKKDQRASANRNKTSTPQNTENVSSRTRSRAK